MRVKKILVSQPPPADFEKTPYYELTQKYSISVDFYKFFRTEVVSAAEFRKSKINILDYSAIVFSSKNAIDQFFLLIKDLRIELPETMKFVCSTDAVAHYLQKYIQYRKRKILFAKNNSVKGFHEIFLKNSDCSFLLPGGEDASNKQVVDFLEENGITHTPAVIFRTVSSDIKKDIDISRYNMVIVFSPYGVQALKDNFPDFNSEKVVFGALGQNTASAIEAEGWPLAVTAPTPGIPSITAALAIYLKDHAARRR